MRKQDTARWFGKAFLAGMLAVAALSVFSYFYYNPAVSVTTPEGPTDYVREPGAFFVMAREGVCWGRLDENGYNSGAYDSQRSIDILLMGSSHVEGYQVPQEKNMAAVFDELAQEDYLYHIGTSGHTLLRNIANLQTAIETYRPQKCVVIETGTLAFSQEDIFQVVDGTFPRIPQTTTGWLRHLQKIPYLRLAYKQLQEVLPAEADEEGETPAAENAIADNTNDLLAYAARLAGDRGLQLAILYHPRLRLLEDGTAQPAGSAWEREVFGEMCEKNDVVFLDLTQRFLGEYRERWVLPHGFYNSSVGSGHLNRDGHRMVAEELLAYVNTVG